MLVTAGVVRKNILVLLTAKSDEKYFSIKATINVDGLGFPIMKSEQSIQFFSWGSKVMANVKVDIRKTEQTR